MTDLLILGRSGQLAHALAEAAARQGLTTLALGRTDLDLADPHTDPGAALAQATPRLVINASAYTAVDKAEDEAEAAARLNAEVPGALARACATRGVPFVHVSTDYVFDGRGGAPYREDAATNPLGVYGRTKAQGEAAVAAAGGRAVTLRTSWVYSATGSNFVRTMLRLAKDREEIGVVADQHGRPTSATELAQAAILAALAIERGELADTPILHVCGGGEASWAEFAQAIFAESAKRGGPTARVRPIPTAEYPTKAPRPLDTRLDGALATERLRWRPKPWRESLAQVLNEMNGAL